MLTLLFWIIVLGLLAWAVNALPIPQPFKTIAFVIIVLMALYVLFTAFGVSTSLPSARLR